MFQMTLDCPVPVPRSRHKLTELHPEFDDYRTILGQICRLLAKTGMVEFHVQGFGEERWRVDVATDLMVILEQLPGLFIWVSKTQSSRHPLDFYEQGVERRLVFSSWGSQVRVDGEPLRAGHAAWQPSVSTETIDRFALQSQIQVLVTTFLDLSHSICPASVRHPWLAAHFACFSEIDRHR
jgi:hypothetical protein